MNLSCLPFGAALLLHFVSASAAIELICLSEQPAIVEGESATLRAWATAPDGRPIDTPIRWRWDVDAGRIEAQAANTPWDLAAEKISPQTEVRKVKATVKATAPDGTATCSVEVLIGKKANIVPDRGTLSAASLQSARHYLLPGKTEDPGYGLYSYLLFTAPPKDAIETARYLKTIEAYLLVLQDVDDYLSRHVRPKNLNITYIPLKQIPSPGKSSSEWAANVLSTYDYAAAQILLAKIEQRHPDGPYLLSVLSPLSDASMPSHLWEDLTGVVPELAWNWIKFFTYLAAQERSWSEESLQRFGLKLRNLIAVGGQVTPAALKMMDKAIQFRSKLSTTRANAAAREMRWQTYTKWTAQCFSSQALARFADKTPGDVPQTLIRGAADPATL